MATFSFQVLSCSPERRYHGNTQVINTDSAAEATCSGDTKAKQRQAQENTVGGIKETVVEVY